MAGVVATFNAALIGRLAPQDPDKPPRPPEPIDAKTASRILADAWAPALPWLQDPEHALVVNVVGAVLVTVGVFLPPTLDAISYARYANERNRLVAHVERVPARTTAASTAVTVSPSLLSEDQDAQDDALVHRDRIAGEAFTRALKEHGGAS